MWLRTKEGYFFWSRISPWPAGAKLLQSVGSPGSFLISTQVMELLYPGLCLRKQGADAG